ncbi:MAG: chorismate--pyruvate lyase [Pseudomonadota bacterium]
MSFAPASAPLDGPAAAPEPDSSGGAPLISPWSAHAPRVPAALRAFLLEPGSLTDRLMATGARFAVRPLKLGVDRADPHEAAALGVASNAVILARHVALSLNDTVVVVARSVCRPACPTWAAVLDRGGRSLGLSLFAPDAPVSRGSLTFAHLADAHPLAQLAKGFEPSNTPYPARACRFSQDGAPLLVTEAFLLSLERFPP